MMKLRHFSAVLALSLLGSTAIAGDEAAAAPPKYVAPADSSQRVTPRASCALTCTVIRISTRCECPMGKTPITASI
jgi:hypothetical protein